MFQHQKGRGQILLQSEVWDDAGASEIRTGGMFGSGGIRPHFSTREKVFLRGSKSSAQPITPANDSPQQQVMVHP